VIAVLGGLGAAVCWSAGTLCAARASRLIGARSVLAWVMLVGFLIAAPLTLAAGVPSGLGGRQVMWMAVAGIGNVLGLLLAYEAMRIGKVSIVAPITSSEGAIAAVLAVAAGEALGTSSAVLLVVIAIGVALASSRPSGGTGNPVRATLLACVVALLYGASLFATGRVSQALPLVWALIPARLLGVVAVTLPSVATRRLHLTRAAAPLVVTSGLCEIGGFASYAIGSRHGIAVSAVLASQFAALTVLAAFFLFRERLTRLQLGGVAAIAISVAALSALQA
jgi:drug/metabolite transporter (DMT)-like permease